MKIPYYHVDAFASARFKGNPAGVCVLEEWLPDDTLQKIAFENNLSETAFFIAKRDHFELRWFTPAIEVDLCGHATVAAGFVIFSFPGQKDPVIRFQSKSGLLTVEREGEIMVLDFPSRPPVPCELPDALRKGLGCAPLEVRRSRDYFAVLSTQKEVQELKPDLQWLGELDSLGIIVTAPGVKADFVSRFFAPRAGVSEDPVTGSAHCSLIPYWSEKLSKKKMRALQLSPRGGELFCEDAGDRVRIGGKAILYLKGEIEI